MDGEVNPLGASAQFSTIGRLNTNYCNVVTGTDILFARYLILQFCNQLHFAPGAYGEFTAWASPSLFGHLVCGRNTGNPDFKTRSMNLNTPFACV